MHDPAKLVYNVNQTLDKTVGSVRVTRAVGNEVVNLDDSRITIIGFNSAVENPSLALTVKFTENGTDRTTSYNVEVVDSIISIRVKTPPRTTYKYNEELDVTGGVLEVTKGSGKSNVQMTKAMLQGYDKTQLGNQELKVTYGGVEAADKLTVTVKDYVTGITVTPSTIQRKVGDELADLITDNNVKYIVNYAKAGPKSPEVLLESMVSGYNKTDTTSKALTVKYIDNDANSFTKGQSFTCTLNANFQNTAKSITIKPPTKIKYKHGESLDLTGGEIKITNQDNTTSYVTMEIGMITENGSTVNMSPSTYDSTQKVAKTLKITYTKDRSYRYSRLSNRNSKLC